MSRGRIVEQGSHHELLQAGGVYARLYERQFADQTEGDLTPDASPSVFADGL